MRSSLVQSGSVKVLIFALSIVLSALTEPYWFIVLSEAIKMSYPFPGMNPYLENSKYWPEVHSRLMINLADSLSISLRPKYRVAVEKRTYLDGSESALVGLPDVTISAKKLSTSQTGGAPSTATMPIEPLTVMMPMPEEITENYLEIRELKTGAVVAAIEIISPKNKRTGVGREAYEKKRMKLMGSLTHLVEIDLLRGGKPMPILAKRDVSDYSILISRGDKRPLAELYAFSVRDAIPLFPLPLLPGDVEPLVNLYELLVGVYERASFDLELDYTQEPVPPLKGDDAVWADELLRGLRLR